VTDVKEPPSHQHWLMNICASRHAVEQNIAPLISLAVGFGGTY